MKKIALALGVAGSGISSLALVMILVVSTFVLAVAELLFGCFASVSGLWALVSVADEATKPRKAFGELSRRARSHRRPW